MSDDGGGGIHNTSTLGTVATHPAREVQPFLVAPTMAEEHNTLALDIVPVACLSLHDILFAFGSSFVTPEVREILKELPGLRQQNQNRKGQLPPVAIFGHADPVGDDEFNKQLSGRRARAVYGLLTHDVGVWEQLYDSPLGGDNWTAKKISDIMRKTVAQNAPPPNTHKELMAAYMDAICPVRLDKPDFLARGDDSAGKGDYQGCSEFNPAVVLSQSENRTMPTRERNQANRPNRRVVVYLFCAGTKVSAKLWPCPRWNEGGAGCKKRFFSDGEKRRAFGPEHREFAATQDTFACRFYQRISAKSPCEGVLPVIIPWVAQWDRPLVKDGETGNMILTAPDLAAGEAVIFEVTQEGCGVIGQVQVVSGAGEAQAPWNDWFHPRRVTYRATLAQGQEFPVVKFTFVAKVKSRLTPAAAPLVYRDFLQAKVNYEFDHYSTAAAKERLYTLFSPWGSRAGKTTKDGVIREERLPPGGASVVLGNHRLLIPVTQVGHAG